MTKWQPIETAPKDGTLVFLYHENWNVAYLAHWGLLEGGDEDTGEGYIFAWLLQQEDGGAMGDGILWQDEDFMPTHWMPVPEVE
ncbi:MAG: hypothetical protein MI745_14195 [Pseudomonadales bacterium]|nr:hypothetical protein [Pseudomonadales bacterium]